MNWYKQIKVSQAQNQNQAIYEDPAQKQQEVQYNQQKLQYLNQSIAALQTALKTSPPAQQPDIQWEITQKSNQFKTLQTLIQQQQVELQWIAARNSSNQSSPPQQIQQQQQNKAPVDWTNPFTNWSNKWQAKHQQRFNRPTR